MGDQRHEPAALLPVNTTDTNCTGGWVGPRAGVDGREKSPPQPGVDPRTVKAVTNVTEVLPAFVVAQKVHLQPIICKMNAC